MCYSRVLIYRVFDFFLLLLFLDGLRDLSRKLNWNFQCFHSGDRILFLREKSYTNSVTNTAISNVRHDKLIDSTVSLYTAAYWKAKTDWNWLNSFFFFFSTSLNDRFPYRPRRRAYVLREIVTHTQQSSTIIFEKKHRIFNNSKFSKKKKTVNY